MSDTIRTCKKCGEQTPHDKLIQNARLRKYGVMPNLKQCKCGSIVFLTLGVKK